MIDEKTRSYVRSVIESTPQRAGDMGSVILRGRRRHRTIRIATVVSVTALVLMVVGFGLWLRPADQPFVTGIEPAEVEIPGGFVVNVAPDSAESEGTVIYTGLPGPEPEFDTTSLGTEIKLTRGAASDIVVPSLNLFARATLVYLGDINGTQVALQGREGGFFGIGGTDHLCVNFRPTTGGGTCDIVNGMASGIDQVTPPIGDWVLWTDLPKSAAVVTAQAADGTTYWQRPIARTVFFNLPDGTTIRPFTLTALDSTGNTIPIRSSEDEADLTLLVFPGPRRGIAADALADQAGPDVIGGTAELLGSVQADGASFHIITFQSVGEDPQRSPDERSTCVAVVSLDADFTDVACLPGTALPAPGTIAEWGSNDRFHWITETSPMTPTERAVVTTTNGRTVEIQQAGTVVFAAWPLTWGPPQSLVFFNQTGTTVGTVDY